MWISTGKVEKKYGVSKYIVRCWIKAGKVKWLLTEGGQFRVWEAGIVALCSEASELEATQ